MNAAAVPARAHIGIASAMRPGFALALTAREDVVTLRADASPVLETRINKKRAKEKYSLADEDLSVSAGAACRLGNLPVLFYSTSMQE